MPDSPRHDRHSQHFYFHIIYNSHTHPLLKLYTASITQLYTHSFDPNPTTRWRNQVRLPHADGTATDSDIFMEKLDLNQQTPDSGPFWRNSDIATRSVAAHLLGADAQSCSSARDQLIQII